MKHKQAHQGALTDEILQEIEQNKIKFEAELETLKAEYEARLWQAKKQAAIEEQAFLNQAEANITNLYNIYANALSRLDQYKSTKVETEYLLSQYKSNLITVNEYILAQTHIKQAEIDQKKIELEAWKTYAGIDKADLTAKKKELQQAKFKAFANYQTKKDARLALEEAAEKALEVYDVAYEKESTVAAVAAIQKFNKEFNSWINRWDNYTVASEAIRASVEKGYCEWSDLKPIWNEYQQRTEYIIDAATYWDNQVYYVTAPIEETLVNLIEKDTDIPYGVEATANLYELGTQKHLEGFNQYMTNGKASLIEQLGVKADDSKLATGWYKILAEREEIAANATEALTKAETEFQNKQKAEKLASDEKDAAQKKMNAALKTLTDAQKALEDADEAGKPAAQEAVTKAENAYNEAVTASNQANQKFWDARSDFNTAQNNLSTAHKEADEAATNVAEAKDHISLYTKEIANWDKQVAAWNTVVTELGNEAYQTAVEGLNTQKDVKAYLDAAVEEYTADQAYLKADAEYNTTNNLIYDENVKDAAEEIRTLEEAIARLEVEIDALKKQYNNGLQSAEEYEKHIARMEAELEGLNSQIEVQEALVKRAKDRLDAAIKAETPEAKA